MEVFLTGSGWEVGAGLRLVVMLSAHSLIGLSGEAPPYQRQTMVDLPRPRTESSRSLQMRLLLVKRGSGLPLYLHLVTDHLRLFTLYEQVGRSCPLPVASSGCVP